MATRSGAKLIVSLECDSFAASSGVNGAAASLAQRIVTSRAQGTSANQVDKVFQRSFGDLGTTPVDYDLAGGSNVKDPASQADQTFSKLHAVIVTNTHASQTITIGGDANSVPIFGAAGDDIVIGPGGFFAWDYGGDGVAVTAGTGDIIQLVASGASTSGTITLIGR